MAERFTRVFSLSENLYAEDSPLVIAAGALQKDNQTGRVFAQLKFMSISNKTIKALKARLLPLDTIGKPIDGGVEQEYLDLSAARDEEFGQKTAISFPNASTRGFTVEIEKVYFADNSTWDGSGAKWGSLPQPERLENLLEDWELVRQYRMKYGADCQFAVPKHLDLWRCSCGAWNHSGEKCHICGMEFWFLQTADLQELKAECEERLEAEQKKAEAERIAAALRAESRAKRNKRLAMVLLPIVLLILAVAVFMSISAKQKSAAAEERFLELAGTSLIEAQEVISDISHPSDEATELIRLCEKYSPYCGTYTWLNMEGEVHKEFSFTSDFYLENGKVYWVFDDSDYTPLSALTVDTIDPKYKDDPEYTFLRRPLQVDDMSVYEKAKDGWMDFTVSFKNGKINAVWGYFENWSFDNGEFEITDMHFDAFTLEAVK